MGDGGLMEPTIGDIVCIWLKSGHAPAMVTRVNVDKTLSLTCFLVNDIVYRDNVHQYVYEQGDEEVEGVKIGYWTGWEGGE